MSQTQINEQEWNRSENWNGRLIPALYFSSRDSRLWVPKRLPYLGWTINFAHPNAIWVLLALGLLLIGTAFLVGYLQSRAL